MPKTPARGAESRVQGCQPDARAELKASNRGTMVGLAAAKIAKALGVSRASIYRHLAVEGE
jgi:hypothetical protein